MVSCFPFLYFFIFFISHTIQLTFQQQSAEPRNRASAEALAVARRSKEASREKTRPPPVSRGYSIFNRLLPHRQDARSLHPASQLVRYALVICKAVCCYVSRVVFSVSHSLYAYNSFGIFRTDKCVDSPSDPFSRRRSSGPTSCGAT